MKEHHHDHDHECCGHCDNKDMKETKVCECPSCKGQSTTDCKCGCLDDKLDHDHEGHKHHHNHNEDHECCGHCKQDVEQHEKVCDCPNCKGNGTNTCKCGCLEGKHEHNHDHHEHHHHNHEEDHECCGHCEYDEEPKEKVCECPGCKGNGTTDCKCGCLEGKHEHHHDHANHEGHHHDHAHHNHSGHDHSAHGHHGHHHHGNLSDFITRFLVSLIFTIPILVLSPMIQEWFGFTLYWEYNKYISFGLATILLVYGGKPFYTSAVHELKAKEPAMMTLVTLAILVSYGYSTAVVFGLPGMDFFWELATLIAVMLLGHYFEMKSSMVASDALESISKLLPSIAHVIVGDEVVDKPLSDLKINDVVLVKPGEKVPVDGTVIKGTSSVDESLVTGESQPVLKDLNSKVIGGTINGDSTLQVKVNKLGSDTYLSQVLNLVTSALQSKSKTQRLADIAAKYLFYVSITIALITWLVWGLLGADGAFIAEKVVTVIVIACPHALGVAIPLVTSISTTLAAKKGLLIKNRSAFENARQINAVVFDKTGTLTEGKFSVTKVYPNNLTEKEIIQIAINLEASSTHPIALGIMKYGKALKIEPKTIQSFKNIPGLGITGMIDQMLYGAVSENYLVKENIKYDLKTYQSLIAKGETVIFIIKKQETLGMIALKDQVKANAKASIDALKAMGIETHMLTGDNDVVAKEVAEILGLTQYKASVLPHEKSLYIEALKQTKKVAMTGDGINDAPALATADLGVAIGAGTDVAIQTADIILVKNDPKDVVDLLTLSKKTYRKMVENLIWALAYNVITLPLAAGILHFAGIMISPAIGAIFMSLSTIIVAVNAQFLRIK